jgi:hypothetical protein
MNFRSILSALFLSCFVFSLPACSIFSWKKAAKEDEPYVAAAPSTVEWKERDWKIYANDGGIKHYFEEESIAYPRKNIVQIWRKREFPPRVSSHKVITALDEFDCRKERFRSLQVQGLNWDDTTTPIYQRPTPWTPIDFDEPDYYFIIHYCGPTGADKKPSAKQ